jgi:hypothetical protein
MTTINPKQGSGNQDFKQLEADSWMSTYLPAICAGTLMAGVLFLAVSCSKKSNNVAKISPPTQPAVTAPAPTTQAAAVAETPKKKVHRRYRPANVNYVNSMYGVSFRYPRKYSLRSGNKGIPLPETFLKPGTVPVVSVDIRDSFYPETDFQSALLNLSVNQNMTEDECMQFVPLSKDAGEVKPTSVKVGGNEFAEFRQITGEGDLKSDLKYFHMFKNNACYEFVLDVDTVANKDSKLAQVDRGRVFHQLERILTTARIKDLQPTEVQSADKAPTTAMPAADAKADEIKTVETKVADTKGADVKATDDTEKAQVVTPGK